MSDERLAAVEAERDRLRAELADTREDLEIARASHSQERDMHLAMLVDEQRNAVRLQAANERLRKALRRLVYDAERVWPKADPTRHHCAFCIQPAPQQGEPPAHLEWCRVLEAKSVLAAPDPQGDE